MIFEKVEITPGSTLQYPQCPNFVLGEFYTHSADYTKGKIYIDARLIVAAQTIRNFLNRPVSVNSTARTQLHQNSLSVGAKNSQHVNENFENTGFLGSYACDLDTDPEGLSILAGQFLEKGPLYTELTNLGIMCFGVYNNFVHIDTGLKPTAKRSTVVVYSKRSLSYIDPSGYERTGYEVNIEENEDGAKDTMISYRWLIFAVCIALFAFIFYREQTIRFIKSIPQWISKSIGR